MQQKGETIKVKPLQQVVGSTQGARETLPFLSARAISRDI